MVYAQHLEEVLHLFFDTYKNSLLQQCKTSSYSYKLFRHEFFVMSTLPAIYSLTFGHFGRELRQSAGNGRGLFSEEIGPSAISSIITSSTKEEQAAHDDDDDSSSKKKRGHIRLLLDNWKSIWSQGRFLQSEEEECPNLV